LVRNLNTIEMVQGQGLTAAQKPTLLPLLNQIKNADKLPEAEASRQMEAINKLLTEPQKQALQSLQPQRGGGGMGGGGGYGGGRPGSNGGAAGPGGFGGMGGQQDPERPFASERNKEALDGLIARLQQ
jgi:hypothetical protein